jgi:hypothetical protein
MRHGYRLTMSVVVGILTWLLAAQPAYAALLVNVLEADRLDRSSVETTVSVACDPLPPNSNAALSLTLFQGSKNTYREGQGGVGLEGVNGLVCDGTVHTYTFVVTLTSFFPKKQFTPGPAGFEWAVQICTEVEPQMFVCSALGGPTQGRINIRP